MEIREARSTGKGPRSRTLASFRGALTDEHLDRAAAVATSGLDREGLRARARALGIPVTHASADAAARDLIARLRRGVRLDPVLAGTLREQLSVLESAPMPEELSDVAEWLGASERERGRALRDVLRLYDAIARSPDAAPAPAFEPYPRFAVRRGRRAS